MQKAKKVGLVLIALGIVSAIAFFLIGYFRPQAAGVVIETNPAASVFIDGTQVGRTPYQNTQDPGEVVIKLIPESFERPLAPYETKVTLVSGVKTIIRRDFGETPDDSAGEILSFEKVGRDETSLAIVTVPDSAQVLIDGLDRAFTPYKTSSITSGAHTLQISASGYADRSISIETTQGYKLTVIAELAPSPEVIEEAPAKEEASEENTQMVKILPTGVGFLRVRSEPSTLGSEVAQVEPGKTYELLETDDESGWFKIAYEEDKEGWVSDEYSEIVDEGNAKDSIPTPTTEEES